MPQKRNPKARRALSRAVFLDRDGVISRSEVRNGKAYAPRRLEDFRLLPGVIKAVKMFKAAGLKLVVVTNQPDIGNGIVAAETVAAMHAKMTMHLQFDAIEVCPHSQDEECECRKPKPGMLISAAKKLNIDLKKSFMIGDRASDIIAGQAVGCYTLFIDRGYAEARPTHSDAVIRSLPEAARHVLEVISFI